MDPIWGASRVGGESNVFQGISTGVSDVTNPDNVVVHSPDDIHIENGKLFESINDNGGLAETAMYPRQPFDFAGRTGKIVFDVSNDTGGSHAAWPEISITDQPVPVPSPSQIAFAGVLLPRNSISVSFAGSYPPGQGINPSTTQRCVSIDNVWLTTGYNMTQGLQVQDGCVIQPAFGQFTMNHFEIDVNSAGLTVFGTDAGTTSPLKQIGHAAFTAPMTRGLVWMKDVHYNANKGTCENDPTLPCQQTHSFAWANFGFDGPVLTRDVGYELPDHTAQVDTSANGLPVRDIGQVVPVGQSATFTFPNVQHVENATTALFEFVYWEGDALNFTYSANGHASHLMNWPGGSLATWGQQTIALPLPASELVDGSNTLSVSFSDPTNPVGVSNVDLILVGAGTPGTPVPTATPTNTPTPAPTNTPTATPVPTNTPTPTSTSQACLVDTNQGQFTRPASFCTNQ